MYSFKNEASLTPEKVLLEALASHHSEDKDKNEKKILETVKQSIQEIYEKKGDINCQDHIGRTPVWIAVHRNYPQVLRLLIEAKANYDFEPKSNVFLGDSYITTATTYRATECVSLLIEKYDTRGLKTKFLEEKSSWDHDTSLNIAAKNGDIRTLKILIESKADVNSKNLQHYSPLYNATSGYFIHHRSNNYLDCIKQLTQAGANPVVSDIKFSDYKTADTKTTKFIFSELKKASPFFFDWDAPKLYKSLSHLEIKNGIQKIIKEFPFELLIIISEYVEDDIQYQHSNNRSTDTRMNRLKNNAKVSGIIAIGLGIGLFAGAKTALAFGVLSKEIVGSSIGYSCIKAATTYGLSIFTGTAIAETQNAIKDYKSRKIQRI